ncbi:putative methyltransferase-domain-containing protein [Chlamydoabsidia padenii]|nr:putative methyltransferase-domain-containing protein [Chlamydoabsidia padenii]
MPTFKSSRVVPTSPEDSLTNTLAKNTALYRLALQQPIQTHIRSNQWYRININIVTEMGLLLTRRKLDETFAYGIRLTCSIYHHQVDDATGTTMLEIEPLMKDIWDSDTVAIAPWPGFAPKSCHGGLKYRLPPSALWSESCYFVIQSTNHTDCIMPLVVGPVHFQHEESSMLSSQPSIRGWESVVATINKDPFQNQIHHKCSVNDKSQLLIKEHWSCGTPGKVWDSALLLTALFAHAVYCDPDRFANHRILDLSAGTGYIGLYIAKLYQHHPQPPKIILTDIKEALPLLYENQAINNVKVDIMPLLWGKKKDARRITSSNSRWKTMRRTSEPLDIVIASDVLFNIKDMSNLIQTFLHLCTYDKTVLYFGYKSRGLKEEELVDFFQQCRARFHVVPLEPVAPATRPSDPTSLVLPNQSIPHHSHIPPLLQSGARIYALKKKEKK